MLTLCRQCAFKTPALFLCCVNMCFEVCCFSDIYTMFTICPHEAHALKSPSHLLVKMDNKQIGLTIMIALAQAKLALSSPSTKVNKEPSVGRRLKLFCFVCHHYFYKSRKQLRYSMQNTMYAFSLKKKRSPSCSSCDNFQCVKSYMEKVYPSIVDSKAFLCNECSAFGMKDYQYAAKLSKNVNFANSKLAVNIKHDLFEKDPKNRRLHESVAYSLTLHDSLLSSNDELMALIMSPLGPLVFFEETRMLLDFDEKKENWQFLRIKDSEELLKIISRYTV